MELSPAFVQRFGIDITTGEPGRLGATYKGKDPATGKALAVKVIEDAPYFTEAGLGERLLERMKSAIGVEHPNLVAYRDCGRDTEGGFYYAVMDYLEGKTLRELLQRTSRLEPADALRALQGILTGLEHLHQRNLVHGNLKLENIHLDSQGKPVITDYALGFLPAPGAARMPTNPHQAAPELISGSANPSPASDQYAAGAILFEMLTGEPPFGGQGVMDSLSAHLNNPAPLPSKLVDDLPADVDELVTRALRKEPTRRFLDLPAMLTLTRLVSARLGPIEEPLGGRARYLLVFFPIALLSHWMNWSDVVTFVTSCLAIIPLAAILSEATEHIAEQVGPALGGFLNATFGNATEILIAVFGIMKGGEMVHTVKASLTGSILGNLLVILGFAMFLGGLKRDRQVFNRTAAGVGNSLMVLCVAGLLMPSIVHTLYSMDPRTAPMDVDATNRLSLAVAIVLLVSYMFSLLFTLRTHRHLYSSIPEVPEPESTHQAHLMSKQRAMVLLTLTTIGISILSEALVSSVEATGDALGINPIFMGLVVIATVGNAAEHATAVMVGIKNKMDLTIAIAMGSSVQVALFLAPLLVVVSHLSGKPMDLVFTPLEVVSVVVAVCATITVNLDGESNWIEGFLLLAVYVIIALAFWFMPPPISTHGAHGAPQAQSSSRAPAPPAH